MAFPESYREEFLSRPPDADEATVLGDAAAYQVSLQAAEVAPGQPYWRAIGVHHLTPEENRGRHAVYVDPFNEADDRARDPNLRLRWGWKDQRPDEEAPPKTFDKPDNEPATNVDMYMGQHIWVEMMGDDLPSDRVLGMHTNHPDELGPQGENWNSIGHHSFYVAFQRTIKPTDPGDGGQEPVAGTVPVRQKLGIDANQPIDPATGMIGAQVIDPNIIAASGVGWVRLNFILGPWSDPADPTRFAGHTWEEAYRTIIDGLRGAGLRIYGLISNEAVRVPLQGQLRAQPASGDADAAWVDEYVRTFREIVALFKDDVVIFESFNGPDDWQKDTKPGWTDGTPNWIHPGWFAILLERVHAAVKEDTVKEDEALKKTTLVSGPLQGLDINNNAGARYLASTYAYGEQFFAWTQTRVPFDGVGYLLYVAQDEDAGQLAQIEADYRRYMNEVRQVIGDAEGRDRPLYISEIGWESRRVPDEVQLAACMEAGLGQVLADPSLALGFWFCTQDFEKQYGIYRSGPINRESRKSTFAMLQAICRCEDEVPVSAIIDDEPDVDPPIVLPPDPPIVEPPEPPPIPPATGNKLGFYLHVSTDQNGLYDAIDRVQPPVMLIHADTANRTLLREIRQWRAPDAFVIGRMYVDNHTQRMMLDNDNPEAHGRAFAEKIATYDFGLATEVGANGRLLIDAWMSLNEAVPGPGSQQFAEQPVETSRLLHNYDRFQVAFRQRLQESGIEAVAFNFGAGNFSEADHYLDHFPGTLADYVYLGFHEYGWPTMYPAPGSASSAGSYRRCLAGIRAQYGDHFRAIITEAGLTRMYKEPTWGDKGWLNVDQTLTEDQYWSSLAWYNGYMLQDDYVLGACLYEVGHQGDWITFRHLGKDNQGNDLHLIDRIVALNETPTHFAMPAPPPPAEAPASITVSGTVTLHGLNVVDASVRLIGGQETLGTVRNAAVDVPSYVTWSRSATDLEGSPWQVWQRDVSRQAAGITWPEFKRQVTAYNPDLNDDEGRFLPDKVYWLPENRAVAVEIVWDRPLFGFEGNLWQVWQQYVQNRVVGLSYPMFRHLAVLHNPSLAVDGRLAADQHYALPRNADHTNYALQTWTNGRGGFAFEDLPPGSYELTVVAPGALPYRTAFTADGDLRLNVQLEPTIAAAPPPMAAAAAPRTASHDFVRAHGGEFVENGRAFRFIGVNIRGLVHYGDPSTLQYAQTGHRREQLQAAYDMGARVARVFLPSMHVSAEVTIDRLREVVDLVQNNFPGLYILPAFANLYADVPFRIPGDEGFYAKIDPHFHADLLTADFFTGGYNQNFLPYLRKVVPAFRDDPAIFAWEVGNELKLDPHGAVSMENPRLAAFIDFMHLAAREIRQQDPNHMVTTGMISVRHASLKNSPLAQRLYDTELFDFVTVHCYNEEYENDDSGLAQSLGLPYIIEEAGFGRGYGGDRSGMVVRDMQRWFDQERPARGYMQWGFMATPHDMGDGDSDSGMDRSLHSDWDALFRAYKERADSLARHRPEITPPPVEPPQPPEPDAFAVGDSVFAHTVVNVRRSPGYVSQAVNDVLGQMPYGGTARVTGVSTEQDGLVWWPIRVMLTSGLLVDGWAAESIPSQLMLSLAAPPVV